MITASQVERALLCPSASILPSEDRPNAAALRGEAIHAYLADPELSKVPTKYRDECSRIDLHTLQFMFPGDHEIAFAWKPGSKARRLGQMLKRDYKVEPGEMCGTADLIGDPELNPFVLDIKTGKTPVPHARVNPQLLMLGCMYRSCYGVDNMTLGIAMLRDDGGWTFDLARVTGEELDAFAVMLTKLQTKTLQLEADYKAGKTLQVWPSDDGCRWCRCTGCPEYNRRAA